jgi:hypothetical protein
LPGRVSKPVADAVLVAAAGADTAPPALGKAWEASWRWRIARNRGRAETFTDARVVARFPGALRAVRCALAVEADLESVAQRLAQPASLAVRIGVAGTVDEAAQLTELASADGLAVSGAVLAAVEGRFDLDAWPLEGGPSGAVAVARGLRGRVFRFKPWTTRTRRVVGLIIAALLVAAVVIGLALSPPPAGGP